MTEVAALAAAPGPAPTAVSGVLGRINAGTFEPVTVVTAGDAGAKAKAPAVRATASGAGGDAASAEGFPHRSRPFTRVTRPAGPAGRPAVF